MADVKAKAHELAIHVAGLASLEARMRASAKEKNTEDSLDSHGAMVAVPVELLKSVSKVGEDVLNLLSEISLIDPMRVKQEFSEKSGAAERDQEARAQLMKMMKGKLSKFFGIPEDAEVEVVRVGPQELKEIAKAARAASEDTDDDGEECGCPNCAMRREVLNGNLNLDAVDLPPAVKQVLKDYADAVREEALNDDKPVVMPDTTYVPGNPSVRH